MVAAVVVAYGAHARAADTNAPALTPQDYFEGGTNTYRNWIEFSSGAFLTQGNPAEAQQNQHLGDGAFGGIEDLHWQHGLGKNTTFKLDGRSIFDNHDYSLGLGLQRDNLGYLQLHFENFRTWYNGAGGYYPPSGTQYTLPNDTLTLDRGRISFEAGLTKEKLPKITFKYTHRYRDGDKSSTIWGPVHTEPVADPALSQGLLPSFYHLDERVDTFELNAKKQVKTTSLGLGLQYEHGDLNDTLHTTPYRGEPTGRDVTDNQGNRYDLFSVNASSETWLKNNLFLTTGYLFDNLDNYFSGSRIYGDYFGAAYSPNPLNTGLGYYGLSGGSHLQEHVVDLNLMAIPIKTFTIVPAIRIQKEYWDADSTGTGTLKDYPTDSFNSQSTRDVIDVAESLNLRYTGVTNWVFSARGEWNEGHGNLKQNGGLSQVNNTGVPTIFNETDDSRLFQKYSAGARWYPLRRLTIDLGGYYKNHQFDYRNPVDSTPNDPASLDRYPGYLVMQDFETYDGNCRLTLRPLQNLALVSRYEYQFSTIHTRPDSASMLPEVESSKMTSHILAQDITWIPWSRLSLQAGFNYVLSETKTPASGDTRSLPANYTRNLLDAQNNYWTVNFSSGLVLDNQTDLNVAYFYYQADDYQNFSPQGVPLGAGARQQGVTATLTRRLTRNLRLILRYGYSHYTDELSGGHNDYDAHVIFSSIQYRF